MLDIIVIIFHVFHNMIGNIMPVVYRKHNILRTLIMLNRDGAIHGGDGRLHARLHVLHTRYLIRTETSVQLWARRRVSCRQFGEQTRMHKK